ncbi:cache domain-containing protein [Duganella sp. LX20W]|uniref:Cache domain-containing protein n=1 Tax=Rugamonas brunnea TaxID=2758569 RepID=A0A7W2EVW9_9BURK|nr:cache domain-containing protein [Rugamonas brunnea]MBA5639593.1 cache domain-containing protein [Rugamonas brunnea]
MRKFISAFLISALCLVSNCFAEDHGTAEQAVQMVHKVIADIKAHGRDKTIAEINTLSPNYRDRDLYVTIMDLKGVELAHGSNKRMQGVNLIDIKDQDGKLYIRERLEMAKAKGKGWQDYKFVNPVSKTIEPKSMYFEKYEDLIVSCGIYKDK